MACSVRTISLRIRRCDRSRCAGGVQRRPASAASASRGGKEAEARCIGAGSVREGPGVTRISAINGPGMCGADYPFRVSTLGVPMAMSFDDLRPPASIPNATRPAPPRWPINQPVEDGGAYEPRGCTAAASRDAPAAGAAARSGIGLSAAPRRADLARSAAGVGAAARGL